MAIEDLTKAYGLVPTTSSTGTLGLEAPSPAARIGSRISSNLIKMGGYDPMALPYSQRSQARSAGLKELADRLYGIGATFSGDPARMALYQEMQKAKQPKAGETAKQGSLWKDQDSGQTFRELIIGNELFFQSPNTGQSLSLEEMQSLYPKIRPTTAGEPAKYFSSFDDFRKESSELLTTGQSIDRLNKYLDNLQKTPIGLQRLYEKFSTTIKTIAGDSDLTEQEVALKVASGNLQGLVGANRLEIAGPGVLTEQDWQRILDALGGDVTLLQNPTIVFPLINEILQDKVERYNDQASFYNAAVESGNYGTSFKAKDIKQFTPRSYLPEGAPAGSRLIGVEGNTLYYITPDGQAFKYEQD